MSKYKFELNRSGVRALLRSDEVKAILKSKADAAAQACGNGYLMQTRVVARVSAVSAKAKQDNLKNNTILKALK